MKHFYAFLFLFLLASLPGFAQNDFKPGYILQKSDTVRGLINNHGDKRLAVLASFKTDEKAATQNFAPSAIDGYGITNGYAYETKKISTADSTYQMFMRVLAKGPANLYFYKDQNSGDHFFLEKSDTLQELIYKKVLEPQPTGEMAFVTYKTYKTTFYNAFKDCPTIGSTIAKMDFKEGQLINVVSLYNQCVSPTSETRYKVKARKSIVTWGVSAGGHMSKFSLETSSPTISSTSELGYQGGLMLNMTLPWASERISALLELQYASTSFNSQGAFDHNNGHTEYTVVASYQQVKVPVSIRYTFPGGGIRPFFNAGVLVNYALSQQQRYNGTHQFTYSQEPTKFDRELVPYIGKYVPGLILGGGLMLPAWGAQNAVLEMRYERTNGNSRTAGYDTGIQQISLNLGLFF